MFENIDLKTELLKERTTAGVEEKHLMSNVHELLHTSEVSDQNIFLRLRKGKLKNEAVATILVSENDQVNIFTLGQIKNVSVNYRLRFLDSNYFKGEYPYEAIINIREFEKRNACEIKQFKVMAPTKMFRLLDPDKDPLLFADIGNGNYYLIHQWGNDLAWYRKFLAWPVRNLQNIALTLLSISLLLTFILPDAVFTDGGRGFGQAYLGRMIFFLLFTLGSFAFAIRISLRGNKNLSDLDWDNRFMY